MTLLSRKAENITMNLDPNHFKALLDACNEWNTLDITYAGGGAHKQPDGGYLMQAEIYVYVQVPNGENVERLGQGFRGELNFTENDQDDSEQDALEDAPIPSDHETSQNDQES